MGQSHKIASIAAETFTLEVDGKASGNLKPGSIAAPEEEGKTGKEDTKKEDTKKEDTKKEDTKKEDTKEEDTSDAQESKKVSARQKDEKVVVIGGRYTGKIATVKEVAEQTATLSIGQDVTGNIPFKELFGVGDMVKSISGKYEGQTHKIASIAAETFTLEVDGKASGNLKPDSIAAPEEEST